MSTKKNQENMYIGRFENQGNTVKPWPDDRQTKLIANNLMVWFHERIQITTLPCQKTGIKT